MIDKKRLIENAKGFEIELSDKQAELLDAYGELLVEKNKVMNLTAITDPDGVENKHLLDSLLCAALPQIAGRVADVGTGAGFPGVVIKIAKPEAEVTLIDATLKKLVFIEECCADLGISIVTVHGRAEELSHRSEYRESFDCVTARALANLPSLCEYCLPLVKVGGWFVAMKGPEAYAETELSVTALSLLGGEIKETKSLKLPDGEERVLVVIKKISQTPSKYPRSGKNITKNPIKNV
ncbi:MAG: 16S rRNA (guanine(527)-N(7))-methyltransferase RsmG [Oscillospiraceae bacterium]